MTEKKNRAGKEGWVGAGGLSKKTSCFFGSLFLSLDLAPSFLSSDSSHVPPVAPRSLKTFAFFSSISAAAAANEALSLWATS